MVMNCTAIRPIGNLAKVMLEKSRFLKMLKNAKISITV